MLNYITEKMLIIISIVCLVIAGGIAAGVKITEAVMQETMAVNDVFNEAEELSSGYFYDEALNVIEASQYKEKEKFVSLKKEIESKREKLVPYDGQFYHVFFHSLIVYPSLAFDGDFMHEGYDMWMTTVSEFKAMLPQLYERGFVLYPLDQIKKDEKIMLPEGKKPLIISIDDVNYYEYMENDGFADKLIVDENGNVACEVKTPEGERIISYEGDVMPILDAFVKEHPDFSFKGAKGVVAVTGYEGAFGYDFENAQDIEKESLRNEAKKVATALKNTGWLIACHSYTHNSYFMDGNVSDKDLHYDTGKFNRQIRDVVLQPDIYISPFGYHLSDGDPRLSYLKDMGYTYFCPVSSTMRTIFTKDGGVIQERFNLDRYNMRNKKEFINNTFFDVDTVYYR